MVGKSKPLDTDVCLYARLFCSNVETCILYIMIYTNVSMTMHKTLPGKVGNGSPMYKDFEILICFRWNLFGLFSSLYDQLFVESCISYILLYTLMRKSTKIFTCWFIFWWNLFGFTKVCIFNCGIVDSVYYTEYECVQGNTEGLMRKC